jgi:hypothetical protein
MNRGLLLALSFLLCFSCLQSNAQSIPAKNENIPFLVTFGKESEKAWGDDDNNQIVFFSIPKNQKTPSYEYHYLYE